MTDHGFDIETLPIEKVRALAESATLELEVRKQKERVKLEEELRAIIESYGLNPKDFLKTPRKSRSKTPSDSGEPS